MKKTLYTLGITALLALILSACGTNRTYSGSSSGSGVLASTRYDWSFESMLSYATDVVIVQYVGSRPFGQAMTEFEFLVTDRVLGNAPDRIFIYTSVRDGFLPPVVSPGINYMLPLERIGDPYAKTHEDGYIMLASIVINMDNPELSVTDEGPLSLRATSLAFDSNTTATEIISVVSDLTRNNPPGRSYIRSTLIDDIVHGSPNILVIEVDELWRLSCSDSDWAATDLYYVIVLETLKGNVAVGQRLAMTFFADTVSLGEQHIVATWPISEYSPGWHDFTSRNSLFDLDQRGEIMMLIVNRNALNAAITEAQSRDEETYTPESWEELQTALEAAIRIRNNPLSTQAQVDAATARLIAAIDALEVPFVEPDPEQYQATHGGGGASWPRTTPQPTTQPPQPLLRFQIGSTRYTLGGIPHIADAAPFIVGNRAHIPLRIIAEALGAQVTWNPATRTGYMTKGDITVYIVVDQPLPDGMGTPVIINNRTFVPARYISETFGAEVRWDRENSAVYVYPPE